MPVPQVVLDHYRSQQRLTVATLALIRAAWARMGSDFDGSWESVAPVLTVVVMRAQAAAAESGAGYVGDALEEQGVDAVPLGQVVPAAFVGVASDGRRLDSLLSGAVVHAKAAVVGGADVAPALAAGGVWLDMVVQTQVADAARGAAGVGIAVRPTVGWTRMLNLPSCSRCVVLAGRFFRYNQGFQRHPRCDCRHIPTSEAGAGDVRTDSREYFDSLSEAEQDRVFTNAGARAIRDGADIGQVVNARRGMATAVGPSGRRHLVRRDVFGQQLFVTNEGVSRRGVAGRVRLERRGRAGGPRLMPESIYEIAEDRDDAIRLLRVHGYIR